MMKHKVAHGAAIMATFQLASRVMEVLALLLLARWLAPADFGLVAIATSVLLVLTAVTELPVIDILVQRPHVIQSDVDAAFTTNLIRGLVVTGLMVLLSFPVAEFYGDSRLLALTCVLAVVPLAKSLESPALVHAVRNMDYNSTAQILLVGKITGCVLSIGMAILTHSYWSLVSGVAAGAATSAAISYILAPYRPKMQMQGVLALLNFAGWVTLSRIFFTLNQQGDRFFIGHLLGTTKLGNYTIGSDISSAATNSIAGPILRPMFAGMARIHSDTDRLRAAYLKCQQALMMIVVPFGTGLAVLADLLVPLVLGPVWQDTIVVIWWLAPVIALQMLSVPVQALSMAKACPEALAVREGGALIVRLPLTLLAAYHYGILGAVIARSTSAVVIILFNMGIAWRLVDASIFTQLLAVWRSLVSAAAMVAIILCTEFLTVTPLNEMSRAFELIAFIVLGGVSYVVTHLFLWWCVGRPQGAETFLFDIVISKVARVRKAKARPVASDHLSTFPPVDGP